MGRNRPDGLNVPERDAISEHVRSLRLVADAFERLKHVGEFYLGGTRFSVSADVTSTFDTRDGDDLAPMEAIMTRFINSHRDELVARIWQETTATIVEGIAVAKETEQAALRAAMRLSAPVSEDGAA